MIEDPNRHGIHVSPHSTDSVGNVLPEPSEWFGDKPLGSASWHIRIEALRAAAVVGASDISMTTDAMLSLAKRFERYLEAGE